MGSACLGTSHCADEASFTQSELLEFRTTLGHFCFLFYISFVLSLCSLPFRGRCVLMLTCQKCTQQGEDMSCLDSLKQFSLICPVLQITIGGQWSHRHKGPTPQIARVRNHVAQLKPINFDGLPQLSLNQLLFSSSYAQQKWFLAILSMTKLSSKKLDTLEIESEILCLENAGFQQELYLLLSYQSKDSLALPLVKT